jgi:putative hydrolase of the HAD superfamily
MAQGTVLWDFDGTLAHRPMMWSRELLAAAQEAAPECALNLEALRPHLLHGFPWHEPEVEHLHLCDPDAWWEHVGAILSRALQAVGFAPEQADETARRSRAKFVDPTFYEVFEDVGPALDHLTAQGWEHLVLSNHVPELPAMVEGMGLAHHFRTVLSSANLGYDKPHPEIFRLAREAAGHPEVLWMVGDNPVADYAGATACGIPAILVRTEATDGQRRAADLWGAARIIESDGAAT